MDTSKSWKEAANEYAELVCSGQFPIEYTRDQVVKHTANDFLAGINYLVQTRKNLTDKEVKEFQEIEDELTELIGKVGNAVLSALFLKWMEKRNELNHNRLTLLESAINKAIASPLPVADTEGEKGELREGAVDAIRKETWEAARKITTNVDSKSFHGHYKQLRDNFINCSEYPHLEDYLKTISTPPQLREGEVEDGWVKDKPKDDREFVMVTATWLHKEWNYTLWQVIKIVVGNEFYYGLCNEDGDEWGDYDDLTADLYKIIPNPPKP
jgi:hypothetical protein